MFHKKKKYLQSHHFFVPKDDLIFFIN